MTMRAFETKEISHNDSFAVTFLYRSLLGRLLLKLLIKTTVSKIFGFTMERSISRIFIRSFIKRNNINMNEYEDVRYASFNEFFTRLIKKNLRSFSDNEGELTAPCDGKLTAYPITANSTFRIKGSVYDVDGLLQDRALADEFKNGVCLIFRLTPDDYHRFSFIDDGEILYQKRIKGVLHTVRPISQQKYNVYAQNSREYTVMQMANFGKVIQVEVGALFVGRITNHMMKGAFGRGDEKGVFEFGGSTVVMLFRENTVTVDDAIFEHTQQNKETIVRMGYRIGQRKTQRGEYRQ